MTEIDPISPSALGIGYLLLLAPLAVLLHQRVPLVRETLFAVVRMSVQLLLVGLYLGFLFQIDHAGLNLLWILVMISVAGGSVLRGCGLSWRRFALPVGCALCVGTAIPVAVVVGLVLRRPGLLEARILIPVAGMILGNCLRADIVGLRSFHAAVTQDTSRHQQRLSQGATLHEALLPTVRDAIHAALAPTLATMATIGLVSLPGMMTGILLAGADVSHAVRYQVVIMLAIYAGTALSVFLGIRWTLHARFDPYGLPRPGNSHPGTPT